MAKIIEALLEHNILTKEAISKLLKLQPPRKITVTNLIIEGLLEEEKLSSYLVESIKTAKYPLTILSEIGGIEVNAIVQRVAEEFEFEFVDIEHVELDAKLFSRVPFAQLLKHQALPIEEEEDYYKVAFGDPLDLDAHDAIARLLPKKPIKIAIANPKEIEKQLSKLQINESVRGIVDEIRRDLNTKGGTSDTADESPAVVRLIDIILKSAIDMGTSDIHIEANEKSCVVRERIDGMLRQTFLFDKDIFNPLSSRMKLLSGLDIAEKRKPQDGRFSHIVNDKEYDFRVSSLPTIYGESIVLRILDKSKAMIRLEDAGMSSYCYDKFSDAIKAPYGIVLVTGPTGSGKTTTLYGALNAIRDEKDKIITVEDPVEYQMSGLQQVQVKADIGMSFAAALKSILRQDPDKIMIGEIRDQETLRIAIQAALTGHLVLSTLHTNDSIAAVSRILDMGIEEYLVSGALVAIQAQRLVRKNCPYCTVPAPIDVKMLNEIRSFLPENPTFYAGEGCKECGGSGYAGREMISEILTVSETLSRMIAQGASKEELTKQAISEGFVGMFEDGIKKALQGKTTVEEVFRVARL